MTESEFHSIISRMESVHELTNGNESKCIGYLLGLIIGGLEERGLLKVKLKDMDSEMRAEVSEEAAILITCHLQVRDEAAMPWPEEKQ